MSLFHQDSVFLFSLFAAGPLSSAQKHPAGSAREAWPFGPLGSFLILAVASKLPGAPKKSEKKLVVKGTKLNQPFFPYRAFRFSFLISVRFDSTLRPSFSDCPSPRKSEHEAFVTTDIFDGIHDVWFLDPSKHLSRPCGEM